MKSPKFDYLRLVQVTVCEYVIRGSGKYIGSELVQSNSSENIQTLVEKVRSWFLFQILNLILLCPISNILRFSPFLSQIIAAILVFSLCNVVCGDLAHRS